MEDFDYMLTVEKRIYPLDNIEVLVLNKQPVFESIEENHWNMMMVVDYPANKIHNSWFDIDRDGMLSIRSLHRRSLSKKKKI
jgi:hypothetical protein